MRVGAEGAGLMSLCGYGAIVIKDKINQRDNHVYR